MKEHGIQYEDYSFDLSKDNGSYCVEYKSFIDDIVIDAKTRSIVQFLIQLCKVNGMESIAEGVNDAKQVAILRKLQCDTIQGYYYSKPLNRNDFEKLLLQNDFEKKGATEK